MEQLQSSFLATDIAELEVPWEWAVPSTRKSRTIRLETCGQVGQQNSPAPVSVKDREVGNADTAEMRAEEEPEQSRASIGTVDTLWCGAFTDRKRGTHGHGSTDGHPPPLHQKETTVNLEKASPPQV